MIDTNKLLRLANTAGATSLAVHSFSNIKKKKKPVKNAFEIILGASLIKTQAQLIG